MNPKSLVSNAATAFVSQGISLAASVAMSLLVPKVLGVEAYGYWQLFVFYASYSGFFHFGLNDGVYLVEGGKTRDEIDKRGINSQLAVNFAIQFVVGFAVCLFTLFTSPEADRLFILLAFAVYTAIFDIQGYLGYVFQAMNETKLFSFASIIERISFLVCMAVFVVMGVDDFRPYVVLYVASKTLSLGYCVCHARDILASGVYSIPTSIRMAIASIKVGCGLMLANIASMFILGIARALIDYSWGIEVFGMVSFSLSMVSFFITFVAQASMVLFPALRQGTDEERRRFYQSIGDVLSIALPCVYVFFCPIAFVLSLWLPQYASSMHYFAILMPLCVFDTKMDICCTTYFKVLREERLLLLVNMATVLCTTATSAVGIYCLGSIDAVLIGVVVCVAMRSLWSEWYLSKKMNVRMSAVSFGEAVLSCVFVLLTLHVSALVSFVMYLMAYGLYLLVNRDRVLVLARIASRMVKGI